MIRLSLSMIVKNEERYLKDCLESVKGVVDEIVVVDTGSTDNTVKIAEEYGAKIFNFKWINDFSAARNYSLSKCSGEWILYLDADERLNKESVTELKKMVSSNKRIGVFCNIYNIDEFNNKPNLMKYTRLFKNSLGIGFKGRAHEQIENSLEEKKYKLVNSNIIITHIGYNLDRDGLKEKARRNLSLLLEDYKATNSSYTAFQLGNTYSIINEKHKAYEYYSTAMKDPKLSKAYFGICSSNVAEYEMKLNNLEKALEILEKGLKVVPDHALLNYLGSEILFKAGNGVLAVELCQKAYLLNEKLAEQKTAQSALDVVLDKEGIIYHGLNISVQKGVNKGIQFFLEKLQNNFDKKNYKFDDEVSLIVGLAQNENIGTDIISIFRTILNKHNTEFYINLISNYGKADVKIKLLQTASAKFNESILIRNKLGLAYSKLGQTDKAIEIFEKSLSDFPNEPAPVFFLISLYVGEKNFTKLKTLVVESKRKFGNNQIFNKHIADVEQKLSGVISFDK